MKSNGFNSRWWSSLWRRSGNPEQELAPYRRLALQLHYELPRSESPRSVLVVSPSNSSFSAHGSATLASCLADEVRRPVLLIDACTTGADVSGILGCSAIRGFSDVLSDPKLPLEDLVLPTSHENVRFLPAGARFGLSQLAPPDDIHALLKVAEQRYEFVLLSGGSVLNNSMALALTPYVGCVLLLVIENETRVDDLDAAQDALSFCKARKVGLVLTTPLRGERWLI